MALFTRDGKRLQVFLNGVAYYVNTFFSSPNIIRLLSSDIFVLKDSEGVYLVPKEELVSTPIFSLDNYILTDSKGVYLIPKINIEEKLVSSDGYLLTDKNGLFLIIKEE